MADLTAPLATDRPQPAGERAGRDSEPVWDIIELLFFAYRDFISDPDEVLATFGFGRAHHRVLHFVTRTPGLKVAELLDILKITKQSLSRVLAQLVQQGFIIQRPGSQDRRQRLLDLTLKGRELERRLSAPQRARVGNAYSRAGPQAVDGFREVLLGIIADEGDRRRFLRWVRDE